MSEQVSEWMMLFYLSSLRVVETGPSVVEFCPGVFGIHVPFKPPTQICPYSWLLLDE